MLRDRRLSYAEFTLNDIDDLTRHMLPVCKQLDYAPAHRVAQDIEGMHQLASVSPV
jgi:hypothetical protein